MNIFQYMTRDEIEARVSQLEKELGNCTRERLAEINKELRQAAETLEDANYRDSEVRREPGPITGAQILATYGVRSSAPAGELREIATYQVGDGRAALEGRAVNEKHEQRGADLKAGRAVEFGLDEIQLRAVTIASETLVAPSVTSPTLAPAFNEVSSLVDLVNAPLLVGAESYSKGFVKSYGAGDYKGEIAEAADAEPIFDYASTGKHRITAYAEISSAVATLNNPNYQNEVMKGMRIALRKKLAQQILIGGGPTAEELTGIFNAPASVIPADSDLTIKAIGADTLDDLVFGYGGDESLEGGTWLILNKKDLAAFAKLRDANGQKKLYNITIDANGNTGTISSENSYAVRFVINSACPSLSEAAVGDYVMAYGKPLGYEMPMFSPLTVERSTDFQFKKGMVCFRGEVFVGGTPAAFKVFTRVQKKA